MSINHSFIFCFDHVEWSCHTLSPFVTREAVYQLFQNELSGSDPVAIMQTKETIPYIQDNCNHETQALGYRINLKIYTQYAGAARILLHRNVKFTIRRLKSYMLTLSLVANRPSFSFARCYCRYSRVSILPIFSLSITA